MLKTTKHQLETKDKGEEGAALATMIFVMVVIFLVMSTLTSLSLTSIRQTSMNRGTTGSLNSAESGADTALAAALKSDCEDTGDNEDVSYEYEIYRSDFHLQVPDATNDFGVSSGCPETGDRYLIIEAIGTDGKYELVVLSVYRWGDGSDETVFNSEVETQPLPTLISRTENRPSR